MLKRLRPIIFHLERDLLPKFRVLPRVHSFRVGGKRYFAGETVELTEEQATRINLDFLQEIFPPKTSEKAEFVSDELKDASATDVPPAAKSSFFSTAIEPEEPKGNQKAKKVVKRSLLAGKAKT